MSEDETIPDRGPEKEEQPEGADLEESTADESESPEAELTAKDNDPSEDDRDQIEGSASEPSVSDDEVNRLLRRSTRRGFLSLAAAGGVGYVGWKWLTTRPRIDRRPWPFRRVLQSNEKLARAFFDPTRLSPTFSADRINRLRANGHIGLTADSDLESWRLRIEGVAGADGPVDLTLDDIRQLPEREMITELRCIEGWTMIVRWTGVRLVDLMAEYPPPTQDGSTPDPLNHPERLVRYVAMETPGREYYVGLDMPSAIHPQTLLVWSMNGMPLNWHHGAPLRLAIPVKYGIKNIKRIGTIRFSDVRPPDYWGKRGYDWYAGL